MRTFLDCYTCFLRQALDAARNTGANDATRADALSAGVDQVAAIFETGTAIPGASLEKSTPEFRSLFNTADLIISKGQGNYEMLSEHPQPIFFLLKAKCAIIASDLEVPLGSFVLKKGNP